MVEVHVRAHREFFLRKLPLAAQAPHGAAEELECA
jgi:hypothetical protein